MTRRNRKNAALDGVYTPAAKGVETLDTLIPDSMDEGMRSALERLNNALGGDVAGFVCARLKISRDQLAQYFKAEQVDSIALAIYNIEARHEAMVCGDETGVGKGRQAAGIVRYAKENGRLPIFFTEKKNLFSDFYRDAKDTGIAHYKPLIINSDGTVYDYDKCINSTLIGRKVAMFLRIQFLEGKARRKFFDEYPPQTVYVFTSRIKCAMNGNFEATKGSAALYAWFVWEKG